MIQIYVYLAVKHPDFYEECFRILKDMIQGIYQEYSSAYISFELFGALTKINVNAVYEASLSYLNLPIKFLNIDRDVLLFAKEIAQITGVTYDSIHVAIMMKNNVNMVITEDLDDWLKIGDAWRVLSKKRGLEELVIISPTRGII
ncbi:MAG: type II toxin-antitoxin system VapC family toxin [Candidatus Njordarchaeia archaeon]|nr:VapC-like toxin [Candidatus Korarchaeota archaeon]